MDAGDSPAFCALTISSETSRLGTNIKLKLYRRSATARNLYEYHDFRKYLKRLNNVAAGQRQKKREVSEFEMRNIYVIFNLCYFKTTAKYDS